MLHKITFQLGLAAVLASSVSLLSPQASAGGVAFVCNAQRLVSGGSWPTGALPPTLFVITEGRGLVATKNKFFEGTKIAAYSDERKVALKISGGNLQEAIVAYGVDRATGKFAAAYMFRAISMRLEGSCEERAFDNLATLAAGSQWSMEGRSSTSFTAR